MLSLYNDNPKATPLLNSFWNLL